MHSQGGATETPPQTKAFRLSKGYVKFNPNHLSRENRQNRICCSYKILRHIDGQEENSRMNDLKESENKINVQYAQNLAK